MLYSLITPPVSNPLTLNEVKRHLRMSVDDETFDIQLTGYITMATDLAEKFTNRRFVTQTWSLHIDSFPGEGYIQLPFGELQSITFIQYTDYELTVTAMPTSDYVIDTKTGRVALGYDKSWPSANLHNVNPIEIRFSCGYAGPSSVPMAIKQAMLISIADYFNNVDSVLVMPGISGVYSTNAIESLLWPYRIWSD